jgi:cation:H+ antiporter
VTGTWTWQASGVALVLCALAVLYSGARITRVVDELADRTGIGEAVAGGVLLGATTSLPGIVTIIVGASAGDAGFALANPLGGIALQTVWLAIADLAYRRANLEHAAASLENVFQAVLLAALLTLPVAGYATPQLELLGLHPATYAIPVLYGLGLVLLRRVRKAPGWRAVRTEETREDVPQHGSDSPGPRLWGSFFVLATVLAGAGWVTGRAGLSLVETTGLSGNLIGATLTTGTSSLAELVTLIAAVRMGALTLGVGDIVGGNLFDVLQIALADGFYRDGPVYADAGPAGLLLTAGCLLLSLVLAAGLLMREERGIGFEGFAIPAIWAGTVLGVALL